MKAEIAMFRGNQMIEETILLEEKQYKRTRSIELEKEDRQVWKNNRVVYMKGKIYVLNN